MRVDKLFVGDIYSLDSKKLNYGPNYAPLSLATFTYDISFKRRTLLYKKGDSIFVDLLVTDDNANIKGSNDISNVKTNEDFVMIDDNFVSYEKNLLEKNIKRKYISKRIIKKYKKTKL